MLIALCDDEVSQLDLLEGYIRDCLSSEPEIHRFQKGTDLINSCLDGKRYDIVFLDIMMGETNGMDVAKQLNEIDRRAVVIFLTNLMDYALDGYEVNAFRYLIKPLTKEVFKSVFPKAVRETLLRKTSFYSIALKDGSIIKLDLDKILYLESFGRDITAHLVDRKIVYTCNISTAEENLQSRGFIRIHKSYIANLKYITQITRNTVILKGDITLPLSRKRQKFVFDVFTLYLSAII